MKARHGAYLLLAAASGLAAFPAMAQRQEAPIVHVPLASRPLPDDEQLARNVSNLLELISHPKPQYATYALLASNVRLVMVGRNTTRVVEGEAVQKALETVLRSPDSNHRILPGAPDVQLEGRYGRFRVLIRTQENGRLVGGCFALHGDAILEKKEWSVLNLVMSRTRCT